ncbi:MAG: protein-L-isoaspartate(D-aspartate) O-methyltransferase [Methanospirillum sp.]|uniref:protein-L-isoaspartate(D-aspartate) O-methyltransferase n=1 Tax=Methanospirillum sp. TaxID=45200 RepID=UPI002372C88D|nr:protein-L-isoaspartate(D-aspartate) O-methyltransferase [Methanospirillum sp.]MDD1730103.1 protein-L-isoaspartate(D-aspartate) O-methyltransferase [Methanospirillum sp.]
MDMVKTQIRSRGVKSQSVLSAMEQIPRHLFVPEKFTHLAYHDYPIPIGHDQTISQPYIVARMTELLAPDVGDQVLEIGTGTGYQAAVLATMGTKVISLERIPALAEGARENLQRARIQNVTVFVTDGTLGWEDMAPYDGIIITAATPAIPPPLMQQLADDGRLVAPVGTAQIQELIRLTKKFQGILTERFEGVRFVPLIGEYGWNT